MDPPDREDALNSLIAAERSFAQAAKDLGVRDAFVAYLADNGVLFRPRPVNAQAHLHEQPAGAGILSWTPVYVDLARSADLGFSTGPWNFRDEAEADPIAHGQFFSIWRKQANGDWKVELDHGTSNPPPDAEREAVTSPSPPPYNSEWAVDPAELETARERLLDIDRSFSASSAARGFFRALIDFVNADVRVLRNGTPPVRGADGLRDLAMERSGHLTWTPLDGGVSLAGDLGYTYGEYWYDDPSGDLDETGMYVRAWRRTSDESWRVVVDLMTPLPRDN